MTETIPGPAYRIKTLRLVVRCWHPADAPLMKAALDVNIDHLLPFLPWAIGEPQTLQQKIERIRDWRSKFDSNLDFYYGIFNHDETQVVGGTGLHTTLNETVREMGYWIHRDYVRQGYATEMGAALTRVAFMVDHIERMEIRCDVANAKSAGVARKLGYTLDARLRSREHALDGTLHDEYLFSMLYNEFEGSPAAKLSANTIAYDAMGRCLI